MQRRVNRKSILSNRNFCSQNSKRLSRLIFAELFFLILTNKPSNGETHCQTWAQYSITWGSFDLTVWSVRVCPDSDWLRSQDWSTPANNLSVAQSLNRSSGEKLLLFCLKSINHKNSCLALENRIYRKTPAKYTILNYNSCAPTLR